MQTKKIAAAQKTTSKFEQRGNSTPPTGHRANGRTGGNGAAPNKHYSKRSIGGALAKRDNK